MNICVIGAGVKGHFGNDFVNRARNDGHTVYTLSHKDYGDNEPNHAWNNFSNSDQIVKVYNELTKDINNIDIFLYNSVFNSWVPMIPAHFTETATKFNDSDFFNSILVNVIAPYKLSIASLKKMKEGSKIIFMTTGMSTGIDNLALPIRAGYAGSKSYQNFIMKGLAEHNNKGVIVSSIAPYFQYNEPENYKIAFDKAYNHIMTIDQTHNGKIIHIRH